MGIETYFSQIKAIIGKYAVASFVISANVNLDTRPGDQGFLAGAVTFVDGSELHFREYLDVAGKTIEKVMYSYHYQDAASRMILRYDNAAHPPALVSAEHKHDVSGIKSRKHRA